MAWLLRLKQRRALAVLLLLLLPLSLPAEVFLKKKIKIKNKVLTVEVADTSRLRQKGLMFRKSLKLNHGMLFVFEGSLIRTFWMKNTFMPLSIGFFDKKRRLLEVRQMRPASLVQKSPSLFRSKKPARYALEMTLGWFKKNSIPVGSRFFYVK